MSTAVKLTAPQRRALAWFAALELPRPEKYATLRELGRYIPGTVVLDRLFRMGLIAYVPPAKGSSQLLRLTDAGRAAIAEVKS